MDTDTVDLLQQGYAWTTDRVAGVRDDALTAPTPCDAWDLRLLLEHMLGALDVLTSSLEGVPQESGPTLVLDGDWNATLADIAARSHAVWHSPGVMGRTCMLPLGPTPAPVVAEINLLEVLVHGWDIGQATGEAAAIPTGLAEHVLVFARQPFVDGNRGDAFAADLGVGDSPSDRLVAFLGRKP